MMQSPLSGHERLSVPHRRLSSPLESDVIASMTRHRAVFIVAPVASPGERGDNKTGMDVRSLDVYSLYRLSHLRALI